MNLLEEGEDIHVLVMSKHILSKLLCVRCSDPPLLSEGRGGGGSDLADSVHGQDEMQMPNLQSVQLGSLVAVQHRECNVSTRAQAYIAAEFHVIHQVTEIHEEAVFR